MKHVTLPRSPSQRPCSLPHAPWLLGALVVSSLLAAGCFNSNKAGRLFGAPDGGGAPPVGDDWKLGQGGGFVLRELFGGARLFSGGPQVTSTAPADGAADVTLGTLIAVAFSESVASQSAIGGFRLFPQGSTTPVQGTTELLDGQTVLLFTPSDDLLPETTYDVVVSANVFDLQDQPLVSNGETGEVRFSFTTISANTDPPFTVTFSQPQQQQGNVPRATEIIATLSEPANSSSGNSGLLNPNNISLTVNGALFDSGLGGEYVTTPLGGARIRGVLLRLNERLPANASCEFQIGERVETADGSAVLQGGSGFTARFTAQDTRVPDLFDFPENQVLEDADGFISLANLRAFQTEVQSTVDGQAPGEMTLVFFDPSAENALVFVQRDPATPTPFLNDLQPDPDGIPALGDGEILVGAFVERRGIGSEVSALGSLRMDTFGPRLSGTGPPVREIPFLGPVMGVFVRDPVIHGFMDESCTGLQIDFDGAGDADFSSVQFAPGLSTVDGNFFVTAPSEDAPLVPTFEFQESFAFIATDQFGNGSVGFDRVRVEFAGVVGADIDSPDGSTALLVSPFGADSLEPLGQTSENVFGQVVLDAFPPIARARTRSSRDSPPTSEWFAFPPTSWRRSPRRW